MTDRVLLRGGCVLTLGAKTPNHASADVLIDDGKIAEVGPALRARDAEVVDATDTIVMPGFVDTHRHAWRSLFRNLGETASSGEGSAAVVTGDLFGPDEVYAATLIGLLGAVEAGITTVVDWSDLLLDDASADAALQAHVDAGLRTVLVAPRNLEGRDDASRQLLARLVGAAGPSTSIAVGSELGGTGGEHVAGDRALARDLGAPLQLHLGSPAPGAVAGLGERAALGGDVTLVHCSGLDETDLSAVASSGASVSLAPSSEMAGGLGAPPIQEIIDRGIRPGLGTDDERVAPGDLFAQMRATISLQHATVFDRKLAGKAGLPRLMSTRDVIRYATAEGARVAGIGEVTGTIEQGKHADLIVLRTDHPNIFPVNDPIGAVVWGMDTSNVDWVVAGGRVLMRDGVLQGDVGRARELAMAARKRVAGGSEHVVGFVLGAER
jgi:cytosine/adenosine deaminase-related metal-dependent hydrolase